MLNPIRPTIKTEILPIIFILTTVFSSFYFYAHFPERVATHWNFAGEPDSYSSRGFAAFFFPGIITGMYLLFLLIPYIDPKKNRYNQFKKVYHIFKLLIVLFITVIYFIASLKGIGYDINISRWAPGLVGLLFIIIGNYMSKIKPNWFMGIRTPWTLSSEEVWNKTHRFGGKAFILGGVLIMVVGFLPFQLINGIFLVAIIIIALSPVVYSYWLYRNSESVKEKPRVKRLN